MNANQEMNRGWVWATRRPGLLRALAGCVVGAAVMMSSPTGMGAVRGPAAARVNVVRSAPAVIMHVPNRHLHGVKVELTHGKERVGAAIAKGRKHVTLLSRRVYHWDAARWIMFHRGYGRVEGVVTDTTGHAMAAARVLLKKPGGRMFVVVSRRHSGLTAGDGSFVMHRVRAGTYRVVAAVGKARAFVKFHLGTGQVETAVLRV